MAPSTQFRLPTNVRPVRYKLTLTPDLERFTFAGEVSIEIDVVEATDSVTLNAADLEIAVAELTLEDGAELPATVVIDEETERAAFQVGRILGPGKATLRIRFTGTLNDQLRGFYRSRYEGPDGETRHLATTQFEATDARRAFPCWDEPAVKATFRVTLVVPSDLVAISNQPLESEAPAEGGRKALRFAESPRMSTYLLAFLVGDLASVEAEGPNGTTVRVWATRGKEQQGRFALEHSVKLLEYFNDYFGIPYPLPKMDHIAVPDFAAGAMENWGAITYREVALLFDPENSAAGTRQRILEIVSHEMAHMWFGDLVTMEWWDDLWLNESFASWMGDKAVDQLYPEWNMWTQFVFQDTNTGLSLDGLKNSHPIEVEVNDPAEIREMFDAISYSKGGATLRMLEDFLGPETFRRGLRRYIDRHKYGNARTEHLWDALEEASGKPVTAIMDTWIKQTGFPVLEVETISSGPETGLKLTQRRFLYDHLLDVGDQDPTLWQVPVSIASDGPDRKQSLLASEREVNVSLGEVRDWFKVNAAQTGFFRVNYPREEWDRLRSAIEVGTLPATDRLGLQNDAFALMRAGYAPATLFLSVAEAYRGEDDSSVWSDLSANLRGLENLLGDEPFIAAYRSFAGSLYEPIVAKVGWDAKPGEGHLDSLLRSTVLASKGGFADAGLGAGARARFEQYVDDSASLHPDLRGAVLGIVARDGDRSTYDTFWRLYREAGLQEEKMRLLGGLARFSQPDLVRETLERSLGEEVRIQDTPLAIVATGGSLEGRDLTWEFMKENWAELDRRYSGGGFAITRLVAVTMGFTTDARYQDVEAFFDAHPTPGAARTIRQSLERIRLNVAWLERNRAELGGWFAARG